MSVPSPARPGSRFRRPKRTALLVTTLLVASAPVAVAATGAAPAAIASQAASPTDSWPMFHGDPVHSGYSALTPFTASNAGTMALDWRSYSGGPLYGSPVVAYSAGLGKTVVYQGSQHGLMSAFDAATGKLLWQAKLTNVAVNSTPSVVNGFLYFGATDHNLYKLNADTGQVACKVDLTGQLLASPVVADVDGTGLVVYIGDGGASGNDDGGHEWAVRASDCSVKWSYSTFGNPPGSAPLTGSWSPPAIAVDSTGRPLLVFGGSSPEGAVYALDARDGTRAWFFQTLILENDDDVGAGPTISAPGVNGFPDGVVYVNGKNRYMYALNLTTGTQIWNFPVRTDSPSATGNTKTTASLVGNRLYFGYGEGVYALDAVTGAKIWKTTDVGPKTQIVISSVAVSGPAGNRVVFFGDVAAGLVALDASTGARVWTYPTGGMLGSPALAGNHLFVPGLDGYLSAFALPADIAPRPSTAITSPINNSVTDVTGLATFTSSGTATSTLGVSSVAVSLRDNKSLRWYNATTKNWNATYIENTVPVASPGSTSTTWSFAQPVIPGLARYFLQAVAVASNGARAALPANVNYTLTSASSPPTTTITSPTVRQLIVFPGGVRQNFSVTVTGTATDLGGANPGIKMVYVRIKNRDHNEFWCGPLTCADPSGWQPQVITVPVVPDSPNATTTTWSMTFTSYNHPHAYSVTAYSKDLDNNLDTTNATVSKFCIADAGYVC